MAFEKITEADSLYNHLDKMPVTELLRHINEEDKKVPAIIEAVIPQIAELTTVIVDKMLAGGRLFYIGAGTSGRLAYLMAWSLGLLPVAIKPLPKRLNLQKMTQSKAGKTCGSMMPTAQMW